MKKLFLTFFLCMLTAATLAFSARAAEDILKVGLCWDGTAVSSASLENRVGSGYDAGWFDGESRTFHPLAHLEAERLTVRSAGSCIQVSDADTGKVLWTAERSSALGILPDGGGGKAETWFSGRSWYGGFEFRLDSGGKLSVINVVGIDDYVKGVLPYEMSADWPLEALKAQAVCARTYALRQTRHGGEGFDVCNTTDCQVYQGTALAGAGSDRAAEETAGVTVRYGGDYAETYYCASNGGATQSPENVWSGSQPYLLEKEDPYEALTCIPDYSYTLEYSFSQLTRLLKESGHAVGQVVSARVTGTTPAGNVSEVTFRDSAGKTVVLTREDCRWTLETRSMRFSISGGDGGTYCINDGDHSVSGLGGLYALTGKGRTSSLPAGDLYVITSEGTSPLRSAGSGGITVTGTGWGHGVGMSQYGAKAMAEQGYTYEDILRFYFTGITLDRAD